MAQHMLFFINNCEGADAECAMVSIIGLHFAHLRPERVELMKEHAISNAGGDEICITAGFRFDLMWQLVRHFVVVLPTDNADDYGNSHKKEDADLGG